MTKILLVDDEREEREGIEFLIKKFGYPLTVLQAANGKEAWKRIREERVDILFTDIKMPVMGGLELAKQVHECYPGIRIIIFSAYSEFDYARQALAAHAVSYLLKPIEIEEFQTLMTDVFEGIEQERRRRKEEEEEKEENQRNLMYRILTRARIEPEEAKVQGLLFSEEKSVCRMIDIEFIGNFFEEYEELFFTLVKMYLGKKYDYVELYPNEAYLILYEERSADFLGIQLKKLIRDIEAETQNECLIIVSAPVVNVDEVNIQLEHISQIKSNVFGYGNRIIEAEDYNAEPEHYVPDVETAGKQMLMTINSGDVELIRKQNEQFLKVVESQKKLSKIYIQNLLYSIIKELYDKIPRMEFEEALVMAEALFRAKDPQSMLKEYSRTMKYMLDMLSQDQAEDSRITQKIKHLVKKEYMKDISLNYVAEKVNLTPAYVSYIFKKETGQTLVKYITDVKMTKAKQLLEEGVLKIVQVGRACGYENQSYFNRLFKNYYGVTPKQFREK